jgi:capsular exopolysaccharide synthesis family protein
VNRTLKREQPELVRPAKKLVSRPESPGAKTRPGPVPLKRENVRFTGDGLLKESRSARGLRTVSLPLPAAAPLLSLKRSDGRAAEQYRAIRTRLLLQPKRAGFIVVSSPSVGDGKTVTSINLAATFALKAGDRVLLVDGDLRASTVHSKLKLAAGPGLAEVLEGTCRLEDAVIQVAESPNFYILTAGNPSGNPAELLDSPAWHHLSNRLRNDFRYVIVDSPPVGVVSDSDLLASGCDGVVLVIRQDHTDRALCASALARSKDKLLGVIVNDSKDWFLWRSYSPHHYYYQQR